MVIKGCQGKVSFPIYFHKRKNLVDFGVCGQCCIGKMLQKNTETQKWQGESKTNVVHDVI